MNNDVPPSEAEVDVRAPGWLSVDAAVVAGAGLTLGAFLGRVLAEIPWVTWPFYRWEGTLAVSLAVCAAVLALWRMRVSGSGGAPYLPLYALLLYLLQPAPGLLQAGVLLSGTLALVVLVGAFRLRWAGDRWVALALSVVALAAYVSTLTPAVGTRDGYELQAVSATLGFAHPTGYPLFPILGRTWLLVFPFGTIAWRINLLCALFAAASVPLIYGTARRVLGSQPPAVLSALVFAFSRTLWTQAVRPEKYTLNALFVSLVLYIAFGTTDAEERGPHPHLRWLALVYGLSLGHHRTMLMLAPALALYILWRDPGLIKRPREWLPTLGLALVPLLIYLYIPWRAAVQGWAMTAPEFLRYISGAYYGPAVRLMDWATPERAGMFWRFLVAQFGYSGIALGVLGVVRFGLERQWRFLVCTVLAYVTYYFWGTVWYAYYNDVNSFIPNHLIFVSWIGSGVLLVWRAATGLARLSVRARSGARPIPLRHAHYFSAVFWTAMAMLPMRSAWANGPQVDARREWNLTQWGAYAISQEIASQATILADREKHPPLDYAARIERRRPDVDVVILGDEKAYLDRLAWDLARERKVYLARFLPGLDGPYHLRSLGPLVEVGTVPLTPAHTPETPITRFGEQIELLKVEVEEQAPLRAGDALHLNLYWRAVGAVAGNYQVYLRLISAGGQVWWQASDHPVSGMYPTAAWKAGETIPDWHEIPIGGTIPPGTYSVQVGLFPPFSSAGLDSAVGDTWFPLHEVQIVMGEHGPQIPHRLRAVRPGQWQLIGYDLPEQAPPTGRVPLKLYWQALDSLPDMEVGIRLDRDGLAGEWIWEVPGRGEYPTSRWEPGRTIVTGHTVVMPAETGKVTVEVAVRPVFSTPGEEDPVGSERPPLSQTEGGSALAFYPRWLAPRTTVLRLAALTVAGRPPAAPGTHNFGDRILLLGVDVQPQALTPGGGLDLRVRWECLQIMESDYTLFVQLLGPDGMPKGQIDVWPLDGTHPTSAWREGELIEDSYRITLNQDAPAGDYQIAIGWYLLETMQRLPVLDGEGRATDDKVLFPGWVVQ